MELPKPSSSQSQEAAERAEENRKIRRLQIMMSMVMSVISQDPRLTIEEASELAANAKRAHGDRGGMVSKLLVRRAKRIERRLRKYSGANAPTQRQAWKSKKVIQRRCQDLAAGPRADLTSLHGRDGHFHSRSAAWRRG